MKALQVDLSEGVPPLAASPGSRDTLVVFWWRGCPLGQVEIPAAWLPLTSGQMAELALDAITPAVGDRLLEKGFKAPLPHAHRRASETQLPDLCDLMMLERPMEALERRNPNRIGKSRGLTVSVVVCTRDRPGMVVRCLRSLQDLEEAPEEILVVDNAPRKGDVRRLVERMPGIQYVPEPRPGLSVARNTGVLASRCDIVAFTDDDVVVHPDWIARLRQGFRDPGVMVVTGLVLPADLETESRVLFEYSFGGLHRGYHPLTYDSGYFEEMKSRGVPVWAVGAGACMAVKREAFDRIGLFDERLGSGAAGCGEDSELWYRILASGGLCRYEPGAVVFHFHRADMKGLKDQMYQYMRGHVAALLVQFENHRHWGNVRRMFITLPAYFLGLLLRRLRGRSATDDHLPGVRILGSLAGMVAYLGNRIAGKKAGS